MDTTNNSMIAKYRPCHVVHRRASSDSQAIFKNKHLVMTSVVDDGTISLADPSPKPRTAKKQKLLPESSHKREHHETPRRVPNPAAVSVPNNMDPKMQKKLLNRASAYRYRQKKNEYIETLEKRVQFEQMRLNILAPQIAFCRQRQAALIRENAALKEKLAVGEIQKAVREAKHQALKEELSKAQEKTQEKKEELNRLLAVRVALMWARQ